MLKWKGPAFMITSAFLVCCELYGWTTSGHKSRQNQENFGDGGLKKEASVSDEVIREEDFPTLGEWLDDRDVLYKERSRRLESVCDKYQVKNSTSNSSLTDLISVATQSDKDHLVERLKLSQFFVSRPYQVLGCLINKVASSSIVKTFLSLDGHLDPKKDIKSPHAYAKRLYPKTWSELEMMNEHFTKFIIVRDPLERLVSCYKDKMVTNTHWSLANFRKTVKERAEASRRRRMGLADTDDTRVKRSPDMAKAFWNTEISVSVNDTKNKLLKSVRSPKSVTIKPRPEDIPSFSDFLEFVLTTNLLGSGFSSHWVPYWRACTPCHFKYSVIAKLETGEDDLEYIWKRTGLDAETPIPWENKSKASKKRGELSDYYSSVPRSLLLRVYERYKLDYEMFGYDINSALSLGGHDPL